MRVRVRVRVCKYCILKCIYASVDASVGQGMRSYERAFTPRTLEGKHLVCVLGEHQRDKGMPPSCLRGDVPGRSCEQHDTDACRHWHAVHTFQPKPRHTSSSGLVPFALPG